MRRYHPFVIDWTLLARGWPRNIAHACIIHVVFDLSQNGSKNTEGRLRNAHLFSNRISRILTEIFKILCYLLACNEVYSDQYLEINPGFLAHLLSLVPNKGIIIGKKNWDCFAMQIYTIDEWEYAHTCCMRIRVSHTHPHAHSLPIPKLWCCLACLWHWSYCLSAVQCNVRKNEWMAVSESWMAWWHKVKKWNLFRCWYRFLDLFVIIKRCSTSK